MPSGKYDCVAKDLTEQVYSKDQLYDLIYRYFPAYSTTSCDWVIGALKQRNFLAAVGNGFFVKAKKKWHAQYDPALDLLLMELRKEFPQSAISALSTKTIDELSMQKLDEGYLIIEISKAVLFPVYMLLRNKTKREVLIGPNARDISYYLKPNAVLLLPIFSKSPCEKDGYMTLEKLLVDLYCDRTLQTLYPSASFEEKAKEILSQNNVNITSMINYAKRRKCAEKIRPLLRDALPITLWPFIGGNAND